MTYQPFKRLLLALALAAPMYCTALDYPSRPLTLVVPFAAGGSTDVISRVIAKGLGEELRQPIVVENKAGAGGRVGAELVKRAKADGYTLGVTTPSTHGVAQNLYAKLAFDPVKDFKAIGRIVVAPGVLLANKAAVPDCSMRTLLAKAKAAPGRMNFGSAGMGALSHMSGEQFMVVTGTKMLHVPYQGLGPAVAGLYAGQIVAVFDNVSSALPHIQSGKVCALAVQAPQRLAALPDVPTYAELDLPELNDPTWFGLMAPRDTPDDIVLRLNQALNAALCSASTAEAFQRLAVYPSATTPKEFQELWVREAALWKVVVQKGKIPSLD